MVSTLETLFDYISNTFERLRKLDAILPGQVIWNDIKKIIGTINNEKTIYWKRLPITDQLYNIIIYLPECDDNNNIIESNHFLIQQVRIPTKYPVSIIKIMQIALNIGQWKGTRNEEIYKLINYNSLNLDKISSYIDKEDILYLSTLLNKNIITSIKKYIQNLEEDIVYNMV